MGGDCLFNRYSNSLLFFSSMASELCLQNRSQLVGVSFSRFIGFGHRPYNREFANI